MSRKASIFYYFVIFKISIMKNKIILSLLMLLAIMISTLIFALMCIKDIVDNTFMFKIDGIRIVFIIVTIVYVLPNIYFHLHKWLIKDE